MTHNERVLHTVLSTVSKKYPEVNGTELGVARARLAYAQNRLDEVERIVEIAVAFNAAKNVKGERC